MRTVHWPRKRLLTAALAVTGVVMIAAVGRSGRDAVEAQPTPPKPPPGPTRAALPSADPRDMLAAELEPRLRAGAADVFAGLYGAPDGAVQVFVTRDTAAVRAIVAASEATVRAASPPGRAVPVVQVVSGKTNSLAELERIRDAVGARLEEFKARGIEVTQYGADTSKNKTNIGVKTLTPETKAFLESQFGADKIDVFQRGYRQLLSRSADTLQFFGSIPITRSSGGSCTSGFNIEKDGRTYITTAGHCGDSTWTHNGMIIGTTTDRRYCNNCFGDSQIIIALAGANFPHIWRSETDTRTVGSIILTEMLPFTVCTDGYPEGEDCGHPAESLNQCLRDVNGIVTCGQTVVRTRYEDGRLPINAGDSGSPVYRIIELGKVQARGISSAFTPDNNTFDYTPMIWILAAYPNSIILAQP